ncbi:hypothetical protein DPEC_G00044070 [Dallia pectoralis]|uniref:Uncharacterized protein n=1 Tax=Dallia pectoralis TaxID=75939 RepID=A0ACC2H9X3_DALPE|nr:hypothetical protein DPEC_G00044070 [Dallia pectoralis]
MQDTTEKEDSQERALGRSLTQSELPREGPSWLWAFISSAGELGRGLGALAQFHNPPHPTSPSLCRQPPPPPAIYSGPKPPSISCNLPGQLPSPCSITSFPNIELEFPPIPILL